MNTKTISTFAKEVAARLKGDEAGVIAAKVERKALSAFNGQIAALKAKLVDDETRVEDATEALNNAIYPTAVPTDNSVYIQNIVAAQARLDQATETLDETIRTVAYFQDLLDNKF
jgi:hypothetical protein